MEDVAAPSCKGEHEMSVKSGVITYLEERKGTFVSGEELAERLGCSRAAIWKAIKALLGEGYQILAVRNKGYKLQRESDVLSEEAILAEAGELGFRIQAFKEITSTNEYLKKQMEETDCRNRMVVAEMQTKGKGRNGREFKSPQGGLYLSIAVCPDCEWEQVLKFRADAAVAVYRAVRDILQKELQIRWVNDLYDKEKKVCGILTETLMDFETGKISWIIVGIGIHMQEVDITGDILCDRNRLAARILKYFLEETGRPTVSGIYQKKNLSLNQNYILNQRGQKRKVNLKQILPDGCLLIENEQQQTERICFGEIEECR